MQFSPLSASKENDIPGLKLGSNPVSLLDAQIAVISLSSLSACSAVGLTDLHQKIAKSEALQEDISISFITQVANDLEDFTARDKSFITAIEAFLAKNIFLMFPHNPKVTPTLIQPGGTKGLSGACVLAIRDEQSRVIAIVKGFLHCEELIHEIRSQVILKRLALSQSTFAATYATGKCFLTDKCLFLMLQQVAPGEGVDDKIIAVASFPHQSRERSMALEQAQKAVSQTARALAELHSQQVTLRAGAQGVESIVKDLVSQLSALRREKSTTPYLQDIVFDTPSLCDKNPKTSLVDFVNVTIDEFRTDPGVATRIHGDAHQGNFFHSSTNTLTLIDLPTMSRLRSMTPEWDAQLFQHKIADVGQIGSALSHEEAKKLKKVFKDVYLQSIASSVHTTSAAKRICKLIRILTTIVQKIRELKEYPSEDDPKRRIIELVLIDRKKILEKMMQKCTLQVKPLQEHVPQGPVPILRPRSANPLRKW